MTSCRARWLGRARNRRSYKWHSVAVSKPRAPWADSEPTAMPLSVEAALFDRVSDGVPVADPQWVMVFVNEAGARMLGGAANERLGRRI